MSKDSYDIGAGDICLDFANTNDWHASDHPIENLHNYYDLVDWGKAATFLSPELAGRLLILANEHQEDAARAYDDAIQLREAIYRIFSNRYSGKPIAEGDLAALNSIVCEALAHRQLVPAGNGFEWDWKANDDGINLILWTIATDAAELLTSDKVSRTLACSAGLSSIKTTD